MCQVFSIDAVSKLSELYKGYKVLHTLSSKCIFSICCALSPNIASHKALAQIHWRQ